MVKKAKPVPKVGPKPAPKPKAKPVPEPIETKKAASHDPIPQEAGELVVEVEDPSGYKTRD